MKIRMYDCITRFLVSSKDPNVENLVDLLSIDCNGECSCEDFRMVRMPQIREGKVPNRCKHILAVREYFLDSVIKTVDRQNKTVDDKKHTGTNCD